jgi:hypothetical protein
MSEWMVVTRLSDSELLRLVQEGGESTSPALQELEERHYQAVRTFACIVSPSAGDALAGAAWERTVQRQDEDLAGGVRPRALSDVLHTASGWVDTPQRSTLPRELVTWLEADSEPEPSDLPATAPATTYFRSSSLPARAFDRIPSRSQTVLWHKAVERNDDVVVARLLGDSAEDIPLLNRRAHRELYHSYLQIHQERMVDDDCRRFHRLTLAYAEEKSRNVAGDLVSHLDSCTHCATAVDDLERMRSDAGTLLADALLPWGGANYAASISGSVDPSVATSVDESPAVAPSPASESEPAAAASNAALADHRAPGADAPDATDPDPDADAEKPIAGRPTAYDTHEYGDWAHGESELVTFARETPGHSEERAPKRAFAGLRRTALAVPGVTPIVRAAQSASPRVHRIALSTVVLGLFSLVVAVAYTGGLRQGMANSGSERPSASDTPATPGPTKSTGKPTPTPSTEPPDKPTPSPSKPKPPVRGAEVEWLFDDVNGRLAPDTSGNGLDGNLRGGARLARGAVQLDGEQSVVSNGPVVNTARGFTVSARVRLDSAEDDEVVISQDSEESSAFLLQYDQEEDRWEMRIPEEDTDDAGNTDAGEAGSESEPELGEWAHLTGVYDDDNDEIRLYVNGVLEDTTGHEGDFSSNGVFAVGRGLADSEAFRELDGSIDDVRAFNRPLSDAEAAALAKAR